MNVVNIQHCENTTQIGFYICAGPVYPIVRAVNSCVNRRSSVSRSGGYATGRMTVEMGQMKTDLDTQVDPVQHITAGRLGFSRYLFFSVPPE